MRQSIEVVIEESGGRYKAEVAQNPDRHGAVADDPMMAIRGALAVSRGRIDEQIGYERDEPITM